MKWKRILSAVLAAGMICGSLPVKMPVAKAAELPKPVLQVSFDKNTAEDETGNENDGEVVGNPEFTDGKFGKAIHLVNSTNRNDPARQYVNFGEPEALKFKDENFTVMFWYKADPSKTTEGAIIGNKYWVSGGNQGFTIGDMKEGITLNFTAESGGRKDTSRYSAATDNEWHHVAAVIDRTEKKEMALYVDGIVSGSKSLETSAGSIDVTDFVLGASNKSDGSKFLAVVDSYIDELQVYKDALTKEQVIEFGKLPKPAEPEKVLKVSFDNNTAEDESGNGNDGEVIGKPEFVEGVSGNAIHLVNSEDRNAEALQYVNFGQKDKLKFDKYDFSIMFWYKADGESKTEGAIIGNKYWVSGGNPGFTIGDMKEGITLNMNTPGCSRKDTGRYSAATDNSWHHVAAVIDRTNTKTMALYIDGILAGKKVDISGLTGSVDVADFVLGASNKADGTKFLAVNDSYIDELSVFNYAIEESNITDEIAVYAPKLQMKQMEEIVSHTEEGERYTAEMISTMLEKIAVAKAEYEKDDANKEAILHDLKNEYEKFLEGNPSKMSFHLISDTHITGDASNEAAVYLRKGLQDMKNVNPDADAILTAGDNTQDGRDTEVKVFYDILNQYNPVEDDQTMITLGNHDVRGPNSSVWDSYPVEPNAYWSTAYNLYMNYNQRYMPDTNGATYYDRWINGYHFIALNPENSAKDTAWMTKTQLEWLEEKLSENESLDKPAFVIIHQALNDTHSGSNNYLGFGNQDAQVKEILKNHPQTVFISGHIHNGIGVAEVLDSVYGTLVDVPSFRWNGSGNTGAGIGYEVYLYDTELYLRARDFVKKEWLPQYDVSVRIPTVPALSKEAAQKVDAQIEALGKITLESKEAIEAVRKAYDTLSDEAKAYVKKLDILEKAENRLEDLEKENLDASQFMDCFRPMPIVEELTEECWGALEVGARDQGNGLEDRNLSDYVYWDGGILKDDNGVYHMFASRWEEKNGHWDWWNSKAVHATSDNLYGPYEDQGLIWPEDEGGKGHNVFPMELQENDPDGKYAIIASETRRPSVIYVADNLNGPWRKLGNMQVDGIDSSFHSNVCVVARPDGKYEAINRDGHIAIADRIAGPYKVVERNLWRKVYGMPTEQIEDAVMWYSDGLYHITVNKWDARQAYYMTSEDGINNWKLHTGTAYCPDEPFLRYEDGTQNIWRKIERPNVYMEDGVVKAMTLALIDVEKEDDHGSDGHGSKIVVVPFNGEALNKFAKNPEYIIDRAKGLGDVVTADTNSQSWQDEVGLNYGGRHYVRLQNYTGGNQGLFGENLPGGTDADCKIGYLKFDLSKYDLSRIEDIKLNVVYTEHFRGDSTTDQLRVALADSSDWKEGIGTDENGFVTDAGTLTWKNQPGIIYDSADMENTTVVSEVFPLNEGVQELEIDITKLVKQFAPSETTLCLAICESNGDQIGIGSKERSEAYAPLLVVKESEIVVEKADKTALTALIGYAESQKTTSDYENVISVVKAAFEKALAEAVTVNENAAATQEEVDAAYENLLNMVHMLDFIKGDTTDLQTLVNVVKGMNKDVFTADSWEAVETALAEAEKVLADENAMQDEVNAAKDALQAAKDALVRIPADKTKLQKLVDRSKKYEDAMKDYIPATAELFTAALANAREILACEEVTQAQIDEAYTLLQNAIFGLRFTPNKDKLEDLISEASKVDTADYTAASAAAFTTALDHAKAIFADENATEEQIKAAEKALKKAQKELVAKADVKDNKKSTDSNGPKTGDKSPIVSLIVMMLGAAAGGMLVYKKRKMK